MNTGLVVRAGANIFVLQEPGSPAHRQQFDSKSAAKRYVRSLNKPLGEVRKYESLVREYSLARVNRRIFGDNNG